MVHRLALFLSTGLNCLLIFHCSTQTSNPTYSVGRRLSLRKQKPSAAHEGAEGDCASIACPKLFSATPHIELGASTYRPFLADTRYRLRSPTSMLELTRMLYGKKAEIGAPYIGYSNPYGKTVDFKYQVCQTAQLCLIASETCNCSPSHTHSRLPRSKWTQITEAILQKAVLRIARRPRLVVEVGSFTGRSSSLIGRFLRSHYSPTRRHPEPPPLLCIDTWLGDLGMTLGAYLAETIDRRHGQPTAYHQWMVNLIAANLTSSVLPLMTTSFLGARILDFLRLQARRPLCPSSSLTQ